MRRPPLSRGGRGHAPSADPHRRRQRGAQPGLQPGQLHRRRQPVRRLPAQRLGRRRRWTPRCTCRTWARAARAYAGGRGRRCVGRRLDRYAIARGDPFVAVTAALVVAMPRRVLAGGKDVVSEPDRGLHRGAIAGASAAASRDRSTCAARGRCGARRAPRAQANSVVSDLARGAAVPVRRQPRRRGRACAARRRGRSSAFRVRFWMAYAMLGRHPRVHAAAPAPPRPPRTAAGEALALRLALLDATSARERKGVGRTCRGMRRTGGDTRRASSARRALRGRRCCPPGRRRGLHRRRRRLDRLRHQLLSAMARGVAGGLEDRPSSRAQTSARRSTRLGIPRRRDRLGRGPRRRRRLQRRRPRARLQKLAWLPPPTPSPRVSAMDRCVATGRRGRAKIFAAPRRFECCPQCAAGKIHPRRQKTRLSEFII